MIHKNYYINKSYSQNIEIAEKFFSEQNSKEIKIMLNNTVCIQFTYLKI